MKQYEYKYVKTEANLMNASNEKAYDADAALLTGFGLEGWRVKEIISSGSLLNAFYLMEREVVST